MAAAENDAGSSFGSLASLPEVAGVFSLSRSRHERPLRDWQEWDELDELVPEPSPNQVAAIHDLLRIFGEWPQPCGPLIQQTRGAFCASWEALRQCLEPFWIASILRRKYEEKLSFQPEDASAPHKRLRLRLIGREEEVILEAFVGKVERMDGGTANVTLVDQHGRETFAECSSAELTAKGITEGNRFKCVVRKRGAETVVTLEPIPRRRLSEDEWQQIQQDTAEALGDYDVTDDD